MKNICLIIALVFSFVTGFAALPAETIAAKTTSSESVANLPDTGSVDINTADEAILGTLPGIGPKTAAAIAEHRKQHGKFKSLDDLQQVKGLGAKKVAKLKPFLKKI